MHCQIDVKFGTLVSHGPRSGRWPRVVKIGCRSNPVWRPAPNCRQL